jgi:hypothetical protein
LVNLGKDRVHRHNMKRTKALLERVNLVNLVATVGTRCALPRRSILDGLQDTDEAGEWYGREPGQRRVKGLWLRRSPRYDDRHTQSKPEDQSLANGRSM